MTIKHMPSGLFPYFDSGIERRPFYARAGDEVHFGCRLDARAGPGACDLYLELKSRAGVKRLTGAFHSENDRGQRYFRFKHKINKDDKTFTYRFVTSDNETSKSYVCPVLHELVLFPRMEADEHKTSLICEAGTQACRIEITDGRLIRVFLGNNCNDSIHESRSTASLEPEKTHIIFCDGKQAVRIEAPIRLAA